MQRHSFHCCFALLVLANSVGMGVAVAGEYTYAMAAAEPVGAPYSPGSGDSSGSSGGSNSRVEGLSSRYLVSQDDAPVTSTPRSDDAEVVSPPPPTTPSGGGSISNDKRAMHRWQSLVPGAIK